MKVKYRHSKQLDDDFIVNTWTNNQSSLSPNNHCKKGEFSRIFKKFLRQRMDFLNITVACEEEFDDQIYGFIATFDDEDKNYRCVHFLFVKSIYRRNGIASGLIKHVFGKEIPTHYSCITRDPSAVKFINDNNMIYNPFLLYLTEGYCLELLQSKSCPVC